MPWLTPEELPEDDECRPLFIPNSTEWLAIVSGALTELTQRWNWEQFGAVTVDEAVERMTALVTQYYEDACDDCELPEGGRIIRLNGAGEFEELSGGEWVEPSGDYELPPIPAREEPTEDERKCLAARNAINVLKLLYEDMTDSYNLDLDPAVALTVWAGTTSTVVLVALGLLSLSFGTILFGTWTLLYQALEFLTEDVWDETFTEKAVCALLLTAFDDSGVVTFNWRQFMDNLALHVNLFDPSIGELRLFGQIYYMLLILGSDGLNQAGATTAITDSDCSDCDTGWCQEDDFRTGLHGWTIGAIGAEATGVQTPGVGIVGSQITGNDIYASLSKDLGGINLDFFYVWCAVDNCTGFNLRLFNDADLLFDVTTGCTTTELFESHTGSIIADTMAPLLNAPGGSGIQAVIVKVQYGQFTGSNPISPPVDCTDE